MPSTSSRLTSTLNVGRGIVEWPATPSPATPPFCNPNCRQGGVVQQPIAIDRSRLQPAVVEIEGSLGLGASDRRGDEQEAREDFLVEAFPPLGDAPGVREAKERERFPLAGRGRREERQEPRFLRREGTGGLG